MLIIMTTSGLFNPATMNPASINPISIILPAASSSIEHLSNNIDTIYNMDYIDYIIIIIFILLFVLVYLRLTRKI
jgi:hypothetical protein